ncbi:MAG: group 1 truncated hemoglobin [Alphaproteobacteria bacterium]|nr:MAG: group 1 truncated hemoglobin [Alphaproteobacteria bacterium]
MKKFLLPVIAFLIAALPAHADDSLYQALGEKAGIQAIVQRTADLAFVDPRTAEQFKNSKKDRLVGLVTDQICELAGGPCTYKGLNMKKAHIKLGITQHEFNAFAECLTQAMNEAGVPYRSQNKLLAILAPMARDTIER